jgi:hypothetical protein
MPLVPSTLESAIKTKLQNEFLKPDIKKSLREQLDGGSSSGALTQSNNISKALGNISIATRSINFGTSDNLASQEAGIEAVKRVTSNEWSNALSDSICEWMSSEISTIIAKVIATEVTNYIKTATIIIPPGQVVATAGSPAAQTGSTTAPSPPAQIS